MINDSIPNNPWSPQDEGDHYPVMREWWTLETLFKTLEDNRKWNLIATFSYNRESPSCFFQYILFDITSKKYVKFKDINDKIEKLSHTKNKVDLKYEQSFFRGLYPNYHLHIEETKNNICADIKYKAVSLPHWTAQDITNGYHPVGAEHMRYGWLLNCNLSGTLDIDNKSYKIKGKGYQEHAYGNWSYKNPAKMLSGLKKTISVFSNLGYWYLSHLKPKIPSNISFTTENNPVGYDWFWGVADNDWSIFYGNSMFWIREGPAFGILSVTPDGKKFYDFCNVKFHYNKLVYVKDYDFYYPSDMEIIGILDDKKIKLQVWSTTESYDYIYPHDHDGFYKALTLFEMPGRMEGYFIDGDKKIKLLGDCKIVQQRQPSVLGHNSLDIKFIKPPKGVGIDMSLNSHYLKKKIKTKIHLAPHPKIKFTMKKSKKEEISNGYTIII